jgi:glutamyl/glutaminyl-tRNA synthetase
MKIKIYRVYNTFLGALGGRPHTEISYYTDEDVVTHDEAIRQALSWLGISWSDYCLQMDEENDELAKQVNRLVEEGFQKVEPDFENIDVRNLPKGYHEVPEQDEYYIFVREIHEEPHLLKLQEMAKESSPEKIREMMKEMFG